MAVVEAGLGPSVIQEFTQSPVRQNAHNRLVNGQLQIEVEYLRRRLIGHDQVAERVDHQNAVAERMQHRLDLTTLSLGDAMPDFQVAQLVLQGLLTLLILVDRPGGSTGDGSKPGGTVDGAALTVHRGAFDRSTDFTQ